MYSQHRGKHICIAGQELFVRDTAEAALAEAHRIEENTLLGGLFAEPAPIANSRGSRAWLRVAGLSMVVSGLFRLYSL